MPRHTRLCERERELLARWKKEGISNKKCARRLSRHPSTIGRELKRNSFTSEIGEVIYEPYHAHEKAKERKERAWGAKHPLKSEKIYNYVVSHLRQGWSPEQISGRLKERYLDDPSWQISHEAIYEFIYSERQKEKQWWEYLRRGQKRRRKRNGRKAHRSRIPDRVSIHERPKEVEKRKKFGHWEGDTVVGKGRDNGIHTEYERVSSYIRIWPMVDLTSTSSSKAQIKIFEAYPEEAIKTTTLDNGSEHVKHKRVEEELGIKTYFADPYSAWQRGGNENANMWIRYYFPKGTDFCRLSLEEIQDVEWELNNRPRKRLGFKTPYEVFSDCLRGCIR
jgi:IS30 family transposase